LEGGEVVASVVSAPNNVNKRTSMAKDKRKHT
jgi:hypothetical protein